MKIYVTLKNSRGHNNKPLQSYSLTLDDSLSDKDVMDAIRQSAETRIKNAPETFKNMRVMVEATDGKTNMGCMIDNIRWWTPTPPKPKRTATISINGTKTTIKIPKEILEGPDFLKNALKFAEERVKQGYQYNFCKGTPISISVEASSDGKTYGAVSLIRAGETPVSSDDGMDSMDK